MGSLNQRPRKQDVVLKRNVIHQVTLELSERTVQFAPTCTGVLRHRQLVRDLSDPRQIPSVVLVFLHHHLHRHVGGFPAPARDHWKQNLFFLSQMTLHRLAHLDQKIGEPCRALRLVRMHLLDFPRKIDQSGNLASQRLVIALDDVVDQLAKRTLIPMDLIRRVGGRVLDFGEHCLGVNSRVGTGLCERLLAAAAEVQTVLIEDFRSRWLSRHQFSECLLSHRFAPIGLLGYDSCSESSYAIDVPNT